jgi:23S rRNA (adenine2503-C2)-methyltransferase
MSSSVPLPISGSGPTAPAADARVHLLGLSPEALREWLVAAGQPAYRAKQILEWVYEKDAQTFDEMSNLPKAMRAWLADNAVLYTGEVTHRTAAGVDDATQKLLIAWPDGGSIECVWIPEDDRDTACVSSQVGCPVGCRFCASGLDGVERNLTTGEIVEQAMRIRQLVRRERAAASSQGQHAQAEDTGLMPPDRHARAKPARLSNIVFMGMGEPLANYDNVIAAIRILNSLDAFALGARKITVSTVGLPKQIRRLADEDLQLNLALSLHAPNDALRRELIPWGKVPITDLLDACRYYFEKTGREVTLEYILLAGVNMNPEHAKELATLARTLRCNVNLLRYNPVPGLPFERPSAEAAVAFQERLRAAGVNAHMRRSRGRNIAAACGQLRRAVAGRGANGE